MVFTDGSSLGNPGPTGAGAVIYINGFHTSPILLKMGVEPISNNYTGEATIISASFINFI